jgi:hypothetical protein
MPARSDLDDQKVQKASSKFSLAEQLSSQIHWKYNEANIISNHLQTLDAQPKQKII